MKAVIMAGGEGSRLRPLTCDLPKPLVPVMNKPIMEHIINLLKSHGIKDIAVTLMYLPQKIKDYFGNGSGFGVRLHYFTENTPLGTAGSVKNAEKFLDETFIVISGDSLTDMDLTDALSFHKQKASKATLVLTRVDVPLEYGVVITDSNGAITGFLEKPSWGEVFSDTVNTGTYILEPEILKNFERNKKFDFSQDLFPILLKNKEPMYGYIMSGYWCDIGDLRAYLQAHYDNLNESIQVSMDTREIRKGVWVGQGTVIAQNTILNAPCYIGSNCHIGNGTVIDSYSVLGNNNVIENDVSIKRGILWNNNYVEYGTEIRGAILCGKVHFRNNVSVFENAVVGESCVINERAIIKPNVKIWPQKAVDPLAIVDRNIIWGSRYAKAIFGGSGISGIINVEISPEFATRLGAAYGSIFKKGAKVIVSSTTSNTARMFKHAFISGILSVGVEVFNMSSLLTPISRYAVNFLSVDGGIHIKLSDDNPNKLRVDFMDSKGSAISKSTERKIENSFFREDFKRCSGEEVSRLNNITDFRNYYIRAVLNEIDVYTIKSIAPKVCVVSSSDFVISVVVPMLNDIGCRVVSLSMAVVNNYNDITDEVNRNNADFAALIDSNAETLTLIDRDGRVIKDDLFILLTSLILFKTSENARVIVPVTAPAILEKIAEKFNGRVVRTKASPQAVMEQMLDCNLFKKRECMNQFLLCFDPLAGLMKITEFLCTNNITLSDILKEIPDFHLCSKKIFCPWEQKGKVMRTLISESIGERTELLDGVKFILENGWALVLPDADAPLCRVYAEGKTHEAAENISDIYIDRIKTVINGV